MTVILSTVNCQDFHGQPNALIARNVMGLIENAHPEQKITDHFKHSKWFASLTYRSPLQLATSRKY